MRIIVEIKDRKIINELSKLGNIIFELGSINAVILDISSDIVLKSILDMEEVISAEEESIGMF